MSALGGESSSEFSSAFAGASDVRFRRLAEQIADYLRSRILSGDLPDGAVLPKEVELRERFAVSKPTFREAMRILEAEGLTRVRRGNVGGVVVQRPTSRNVGYTLGLVLASEKASVGEVGEALRVLEPACAAMCAQRADRMTTVVPVLRRLQAEYEASLDDVVRSVERSRAFHEALVSECGNPPLIVMAGALEQLWSAHEKHWAQHAPAAGEITLAARRRAGRTHQKMIDLIAAGDASRVSALARTHLASAQQDPLPPGDVTAVDPSLLRAPQG
jgi:DNA-binding FadR family transcriptional regulator